MVSAIYDFVTNPIFVIFFGATLIQMFHLGLLKSYDQC